MQVSVILVSLLVSTSVHALYLSKSLPTGNDVDPGADIIMEFEKEITALGITEVRKEQITKISISPEVKCLWRYVGTKTIKCHPSQKLNPDTAYSIIINDGFPGLDVNQRISYRQSFDFRTNKLALRSYQLKWNNNSVTASLTMNYQVKVDTMSGSIQCGEKISPVKVSVGPDPKVQTLMFTTNAAGPDCFFYFNRPLTLKNFPITSLPDQKILLSKSFTDAAAAGTDQEVWGKCESVYGVQYKLLTTTIPTISCEFSDRLEMDFTQDISGDILVQVTPKDGIKIEGEKGKIFIGGFHAGQSYVLNVSKSANKKLKKDLQIIFTAVESPPLLGSKKPFGVIEKDGPWKIPFSSFNIKSVTLNYDFFNSSKDLGSHRNFTTTDAKYSKKVAMPLNTPPNENHLLPLEVKDLAKKANFTAGLFAGRLEMEKVDEKYLAAQSILIKDDWTLNSRAGFHFSFLFTDIGLHLKVGDKGALVWPNSLKTGKPIDDLKLTLYQGGVKKFEAETDNDGIARFPEVEKALGFINVVAVDDEDISYISTDDFWSRGISPYDFNLVNYYEEETASKGLVADVVSERPLYLPGELVQLKLFVRVDGANGMDLRPVGEKLNVTIHDSRGEEIYKTTSALNKYGTLAISYQLDPKAVTGSYIVYISAQNLSASFSNAFQVQEFRKPEIKVAMDEDKDSYTGKVTYYSGGEMKGASGEVAVIFKSTPFKPVLPSMKQMTFPEEVGGRYYEWESYYGGQSSSPEVLSRKEIKTDEKGKFSISKADTLSTIKKYGYLTVEGIFPDSAGGKVSGRVTTLVNPYKYLPGIEHTKWFYNAGDKVTPRVAVIDVNGKITTGVKVHMEVKRITWNYERRLGSGNYFYYDSRKEETEVYKCDFNSTADFKSCDISLNDGGEYSFSVKVAGEESLRPATTNTWVMKKGEFLSYRVENHDRIDLTVENSALKLGETFRMMALSPFSDGEALVTFEREGIIHSEQFSFKGNVIQFEKEIDDEKFIPGFYASLVIVKGRSSDKIEGEVDLGRPQFKMGYARVMVANMPKRLSVDVTPSRKQAKPGEMMEATVTVKDYKGKATASELAIAVVDDSLLSLSGNYKDNYDVLDTFYSLKKSKFWNYQTLTQLIGRRTYGKKGVNPGGGGGKDIRSDLKNTAYWVAQVETDENGKHTFKFKLPDNLTTWKIIAVSVDKEHRFGFGEGEFLATKPLTVEPSLPNFLIEGDKFKAQVNVANRSGEVQNVTVEAKATGLTTDATAQNVKLNNGDRSSVNFSMVTGNVASAELTMTAKAGKLSDGLKVTLPVERNSLSQVSFTNGYLEGKAVTHSVAFPKDARADSLNLTVEYSHTAMNGLEEVFSYVLGYPYGCWEQKLSKAYFLVQYEAFKDHISYRFPEKEGKIKDAVQNLLTKAGEYQDASGAMKYYPSNDEWNHGDAYLSIFTGYSFVLMKKMGYKVDAGVEKKLRAYLKSLLMEEKAWNDYYRSESRNANKALILSVLSDMGEKNLNAVGSKLYADRNGLDLFGLSFLGGYLHSEKGFEKEAENVFARLDSLKVSEGNRAHFREPVKTNDEWKWWSYTDTRSQCAALQNLVPFTSDKIMAGSFVREILGRMKDGHWYNTQENIYCFEGLRRFVEKFEASNKNGELGIKLDDSEVAQKAVVKKNIRSIVLGANELKPTLKKIGLEAKDKALYYSTFLRFETPYKERAPQDNGFSLDKKYFLKEGKKFTELKSNVMKLKKGDILKVVLTVNTSSPRYQVMLNDRLAACFEPINMSLATSSQADSAEAETPKAKDEYWTSWFRGKGFEYMDLRLNAAQFYAKKLGQGSWNVEYLIQVRTVGEFSLPESTVEEMYYPDIRGTYTGKKVLVNE